MFFDLSMCVRRKSKIWPNDSGFVNFSHQIHSNSLQMLTPKRFLLVTCVVYMPCKLDSHCASDALSFMHIVIPYSMQYFERLVLWRRIKSANSRNTSTVLPNGEELPSESYTSPPGSEKTSKIVLGDFAVEMSIWAGISDSLVVGWKRTHFLMVACLKPFPMVSPRSPANLPPWQIAPSEWTLRYWSARPSSTLGCNSTWAFCLTKLHIRKHHLLHRERSSVQCLPHRFMLQSWSVSNISANFLADWCTAAWSQNCILKSLKPIM